MLISLGCNPSRRTLDFRQCKCWKTRIHHLDIKNPLGFKRDKKILARPSGVENKSIQLKVKGIVVAFMFTVKGAHEWIRTTGVTNYPIEHDHPGLKSALHFCITNTCRKFKNWWNDFSELEFYIYICLLNLFSIASFFNHHYNDKT